MDVIYKSCCGIDVHKNKLVACLKIKGKKDVIKEFGGQTEDIKSMANWLLENKCEKIAMESTASFWKPLVNIFEIQQLDYTIINAKEYKNSELENYFPIHYFFEPIFGYFFSSLNLFRFFISSYFQNSNINIK